jgi:hypothetical protein
LQKSARHGTFALLQDLQFAPSLFLFLVNLLLWHTKTSFFAPTTDFGPDALILSCKKSVLIRRHTNIFIINGPATQFESEITLDQLAGAFAKVTRLRLCSFIISFTGSGIATMCGWGCDTVGSRLLSSTTRCGASIIFAPFTDAIDRTFAKVTILHICVSISMFTFGATKFS